ncbi:ImmA/IrrE family metallo-endopeptidase [Haematospirillum sp. 15-248]|uniref:ImmA/IrrE family metallo-endopeptidase n=1 Tax=Haematospirillum sp. 15-248 TaxID=2723107 RepID=UPI00143B772B|nr:ImmA/IrrE family metallo-endopeptidase [Haematospirillum sp. 15-248]
MKFIDKFTFINAARETAPVNVHLLCHALGIDLHEDTLPAYINGMIECNRREHYVIKINSEDSDTRKRFTIAHALGHWVYHRPVMDAGICDSQAYTSIPSATFHNRHISLCRRLWYMLTKTKGSLIRLPWLIFSACQKKP